MVSSWGNCTKMRESNFLRHGNNTYISTTNVTLIQNALSRTHILHYYQFLPGAFNFFFQNQYSETSEPFGKCRNHIVQLATIPFRNHCEYSEKFRNHFESQNYSEISQPLRNSEPLRTSEFFYEWRAIKYDSPAPCDVWSTMKFQYINKYSRFCDFT